MSEEFKHRGSVGTPVMLMCMGVYVEAGVGEVGHDELTVLRLRGETRCKWLHLPHTPVLEGYTPVSSLWGPGA